MEGRFRIRVGNSPFVTVSIPVAPAPDLTSIADLINAQLTPHGVSIVSPLATPANTPLRFVATATGQDVIIESAGQFDIAAALGLGVANGGIEVGSYAAARPRPSGIVSRIDGGTPKDLARLLATGAEAKADVATVSISVVMPFGPATITYSTTGDLNEGPLDATPSLRNLRVNLQAIVQAINTGVDWRAELHGYRMVVLPTFGSASAGATATISTGAGTNLADAGYIFNAVVGTVAANPLASGTDGDPPTRADYTAAFNALKDKVDLFNILVLPRSFDVQAPAVARRDVWGQASAFAQAERAFLLVDADPDINEVTEIEDEVLQLRIGVQKDHAAVYWPAVTVVDGAGVRQQIDPSGSVAGAMARTDATRGVWKAPAGLEAAVRAVSGVETLMSDDQNGILNPQAVNAIRALSGGRGGLGRAHMDGFDNSGNDDYKYVPVRRFALFIEESLVRGLRVRGVRAERRAAVGADPARGRRVHERPVPPGRVRGAQASDAYFVKCDAETTTPTDINLGIVNVVVGFAPLKPAEFVVITIQQQTAQVQV